MSPSQSKPKKNKEKASSAAGQLDILFSGPLLLVPSVDGGNITGVEVFSPCNGHPVGAVFVPGVLFSDAELNDPQCERWPEAQSFSLLDPHSYSIDLTQGQPKKGKHRPFAAATIPETNHKVKPGRRLSGDWEVAIRVNGHLSGWGSHRLFQVTDDLYIGADAPKSSTVASMHRLSYTGVTGAEFCGASTAPRDYLRANVGKGGSLIILGEIPYQSTLLHERRAIDALSKLAGLDLHLVATDPTPHKSRVMYHLMDCGHSVVMVE
jgi:hypothetical protein